MVAQAKTAEPTVVNGINLDDLFALIEGARRGRARYATALYAAAAGSPDLHCGGSGFLDSGIS
jgi:hypothetical protein